MSRDEVRGGRAMRQPETPTGRHRWSLVVPTTRSELHHALLLTVGEIPAIEREAAEPWKNLTAALVHHLDRAIHDLTEDWEPEGPLMHYSDAKQTLDYARRWLAREAEARRG